MNKNISEKILVFLILASVVLASGCSAWKPPMNQLESVLKLDDPRNTRNESEFTDVSQKEFFTQEEIKQLIEFGSGYDPNVLYESIGEKNVIGTTVLLQRMNDIFLDGYAYPQKGVQRITLKMGYGELEFKRVNFNRKLDFHLLRRVTIPRDPQQVRVSLRTEDGESESKLLVVPYIYEIHGVVDSMEVRSDKPFTIRAITGGELSVLIYNTVPHQDSEDKINVIYKSSYSEEGLTFTKKDLSVLAPGKAFVSISARSLVEFEFLGMPCKIAAVTTEPTIPIIFKKVYENTSN